MRSSTYEAVLATVPERKFIYGSQVVELLRWVSEGRARAAAVDSLLALRLMPEFPQLKLSLPLSEPQGLGFAVRKDSPLARELSANIELLKASGIYFRLLEKYLGRDAAALVTASHR